MSQAPASTCRAQVPLFYMGSTGDDLPPLIYNLKPVYHYIVLVLSKCSRKFSRRSDKHLGLWRLQFSIIFLPNRSGADQSHKRHFFSIQGGNQIMDKILLISCNFLLSCVCFCLVLFCFQLKFGTFCQPLLKPSMRGI